MHLAEGGSSDAPAGVGYAVPRDQLRARRSARGLANASLVPHMHEDGYMRQVSQLPLVPAAH